MKVIDLLNKIANGEEIPEKIKWGVHNLTWFVYEYKALDELGDPNIFECIGSMSRGSLNEEVEIIEDTPKEDKKIEKLSTWYSISDEQTFDKACKYLDYNNEEFYNKINEIINKVNKNDKELHNLLGKVIDNRME